MQVSHKRLSAPAVALLTMALLAGTAQAQNVNHAVSGRMTALAGLATLPVAAQPSISRILGSETPGYQVEEANGEAAAQNPGQHLSSYFTSTGVQVSHGTASWEMSLRGYGRGSTLTSASETDPQASANRVEYRRRSLTEWYANGPLGLEQGFTFQRSPAGTGPLNIALDLSGNLVPALNQDRTGLTLTAEGQPVLRYAGLSAYDASGRNLRAWLELQGKQLAIKVDDARAKYPVVVDPLEQEAELTASNATTNDYFGFSVSAYGQTIVVGAPEATVGSNSYQGTAYVFVAGKTGWANATQTAQLTSSDGATDDFFGWSVGVGASGVVVGAFGHNAYTGAAYVFVEPAGGWVNATQNAELTDEGGQDYDFFGYAVAAAGSFIAVGTPNHYIAANTPGGAVYVFQRPGTGWVTTSTFKAQLTSSDETLDNYFGSTVAISGKSIVIGSPFASSDLGAAYVYVEGSKGWTTTTAYTAKLTASNGVTYDDFGYSVAIGGSTGNTIAIGAPGVNTESGAVYVFIEPESGWATGNQTAELTSSDSNEGDNFGYAVSTTGNYVLAGAPNAAINGNDLQGAAYLYQEPKSGWANTSTYTDKLTASDGATGAHFGHAISAVASYSAIGAYEGTVSSEMLGASYVFKN